jgi:hypothetical protein
MTPATLEATLKEPNDFGGWTAKVDACVGRWGMRLAKAPGSTREIAEATLGGCDVAVESQTAAFAKEARADGQAVAEYDESLKKFRAMAREKAMFYVAVARAGNCPTP